MCITHLKSKIDRKIDRTNLYPDPEPATIPKLDLDLLFVVRETAFNSAQKRYQTPDFGARHRRSACAPDDLRRLQLRCQRHWEGAGDQIHCVEVPYVNVLTSR
jgi:hypothetical protein